MIKAVIFISYKLTINNVKHVFTSFLFDYKVYFQNFRSVVNNFTLQLTLILQSNRFANFGRGTN